MSSRLNLIQGAPNRWLLLPFIALWPVAAYSQVDLTGLTDRGVYQDSVSFQLTLQTGYEGVARLDGQPVPTGSPVQVNRVDYHELFVDATNMASGDPWRQTFRFNVAASERKGSENGLPPWIPLPCIPSTYQETEGARLRVLAPARYPAALAIPIAAWVDGPGGEALRVNGTLQHGPNPLFKIRRGVGSGFLDEANSAGSEEHAFRLNQLLVEKTVVRETNVSWTPASGVVAGAQEWPEHARVSVEGTLTIPTGARLLIQPGAVIRLGAAARIYLGGELVVRGSPSAPVVFAPASASQPWGGFYLTNAAARLEATAALFTGSGADPNAVPDSHRREECLFYVDQRSELRLTNCAAFSLAGQFGHSVDRGQPWNRISIVDTLIQRCITGGEWNGAALELIRSAIVETPFERTTFFDGDEDGIYFTTGQYEVRDSLIGWAGDDGLDAGSGGGSTVTVSNTWVESIYHEAFAWSGGNRRGTNLNCVAMNSGQGIECGWSSSSGSPYVFAEDCLVTANAVGARFGDNYNWTYSGFLFVTNSLLLHNARDAWGMNWADWTYRTNQMEIAGNWLTTPHPLHPANQVWEPAEHHARLVSFMSIPPGAEVGVGLALYANQFSQARLREPIPVRLSHFTAHPVIVGYTVAAPGRHLAVGELRFEPGQTVQQVPALEVSDNQTPIRLTLHDPVGAQITGLSEAWFLPPSIGATVLVPAGARWNYLDTGADLGTAWRLPGFDDSRWPAGAAELGYGDERDGRPEVTVIGFGPDSANRHITSYFRHWFEVPPTLAAGELVVRVKRDDGAAVYLNGVEVFRSNLPAGPIDYRTTASLATDDGTVFYASNAPGSLLVKGPNLVAVEVHQESPGSSDVSFDLQLEALPALRLEAFAFDGEWHLWWDNGVAALLAATSPEGPWEVIEAPSPYPIQPVGAAGFFRLQRH